MNPIFEFYNLIFYHPVLKALLFFYKNLKDFGLAVIFLTILIRITLFPLDYKNKKEQEKFLKIKKEIEKIEKKFNGERKNKEILALYQKEKINPFFNLLSFFVQLPILVALYQVLLKAPSQLDPSFFGVLNLSKPNFFLVLIAIFLQWFYFKLGSKKTEKITSFQTQLTLFLVPFTFLILIKLPSAISLYFVSSYLFLIFEKILFHV
jgi:YidC/Oxa1 family membrane protein insertase